MKLKSSPPTQSQNGASDLEIVDITPFVALDYLGHNTHNRPIRDRVIAAYAADMENGDWRWNGEGIKFDVNDVLLDGQHRLLAIIQSESTIRMPVFRGLPPEAQETMDGGAKRKFSDVLQLRGESSYIALAGIVRRVHLWESGIRRQGSSAYNPTNAQLIQTLDRHPHLRSIATEAHRASAHCGFPGSILGLCWWLFEQVDEDGTDVSYFFDRLTSDEEHSKGQPIYELRRTAADTKRVRGSRNLTFLTAILIKGWNVFREHGNKPGQVGLYRFRLGGANPEEFPEPK